MVVRINEWRDKLLARRRGRVAFVLSGGGPFGAIQVGLLQALVKSGITPDILIGTSVGALNSVFVAHDPTPEGVGKLKDVWLRMRKDDLFPGGRFVSAWNAMKRGSFVYSSSGMRRIIETELPVTTFEELKVETHICGTNLETGHETWFTSGPLMDPLLASGAMPGIFPPVVIDGASYIDGGVANNVPVSRAVELGARQIFVLNVNSGSQARVLSRPHDFMMHGFVLARAQRYRRELEQYRQQATIVEMPMIEVGHVPFTSLSHSQRLIEAGYEGGIRFLSMLGSAKDSSSDEPLRVSGSPSAADAETSA